MMNKDQHSAIRRIGELPAANRKPTTVKPDDSLEYATEIMRSKDFSQLPVMSDDNSVEGMITWKTIGERTSIDTSCQFVHECMDRSVKEIDINAPLLDATEDIANGYVLIRGEGGVITGIVTASDFAVQFRQLAEPFLIIEEIERHLRSLVDGKFCVSELKNVSGYWAKNVCSPDDLTLGAYCPLLESPDRWERLDLSTCQKSFLEQLQSVNKTRNGVMHFNPCGLASERLQELYDFAVFFRDME